MRLIKMCGQQGLFLICKPDAVWDCQANRRTWDDKKAGNRTVHPGQRCHVSVSCRRKFVTMLELSTVYQPLALALVTKELTIRADLIHLWCFATEELPDYLNDFGLGDE